MADPDFITLSDEEVREQIIKDGELASGAQIGDAVGPFRTIWEVQAMFGQRVFQTVVRPIVNSVDPLRATGFFLRQHGMFAGVPLRPAAKTRGYITVESPATGGLILQGALFQAGAQVFIADETTRLLPAQPEPIAVTAQTPGNAGNVPPGSEVTFPGGADPEDLTAFLEADWIYRPGNDADNPDSEEYRERVLTGYKVKGESNTVARYELVARGVNGVTSVAVGRTPRGLGSADVSFLFRGRLPTDDEIRLVQAAINDAAIGGRDVRATAPNVITIDVRARITGSAPLTTVEDAIRSWWRANIKIGDGVIFRSTIGEPSLVDSASEVLGLTSISFDSPTGNLEKVTNTWYSPLISIDRVTGVV